MITYTQCKQIANNGDLRATVATINDQPEWIIEPLSIADIQAIQQGGCESGAYMPAVTYHQAIKTMSEHGDDVLDYLTDNLGELLIPKDTESWSGMAVFYLSSAVELWANQFDFDGVDWD